MCKEKLTKEVDMKMDCHAPPRPGEVDIPVIDKIRFCRDCGNCENNIQIDQAGVTHYSTCLAPEAEPFRNLVTGSAPKCGEMREHSPPSMMIYGKPTGRQTCGPEGKWFRGKEEKMSAEVRTVFNRTHKECWRVYRTAGDEMHFYCECDSETAAESIADALNKTLPLLQFQAIEWKGK